MNILTQAMTDVLSLGIWYQGASWALDGLMYLVLFTGLAKIALGKQFTGRGGTAVIASVGLALAIGAATLAYRAGFSLAELGPLAWLLLLGVLAMVISNLARSWGIPLIPAVCAGVLASGVTMIGLAESLAPWLAERGLDALPETVVSGAALGLVLWIAVRRVDLPLALARPHAGAPGINRVARPGPSGQAPQDAAVTLDLEGSILELLQRLRDHLRMHGCDHRARALADEILRRERIVRVLYGRMLHVLARRRWKDGQARQQLPDALARVLIAAKENISAFERLGEILKTGLNAQNAALAQPAVDRLIALEQQALRICQALRDLLARMDDVAADGRTVVRLER